MDVDVFHLGELVLLAKMLPIVCPRPNLERCFRDQS